MFFQPGQIRNEAALRYSLRALKVAGSSEHQDRYCGVLFATFARACAFYFLEIFQRTSNCCMKDLETFSDSMTIEIESFSLLCMPIMTKPFVIK
jgi:hypothetical protein